MKDFKVALCGNPNVGKSTVFNALTGLRQHTGNWAGKTVSSAIGTVRDPQGDWTLIDLPGVYSLLNGSPDEQVASDYLMYGDYDAAIVVCDATCLHRSLMLAVQTSRLCSRTILCVNLMDEAKRQGIVLDLASLEEMLGVPVVGISARNRQGISQLMQLVHSVVSEKEERWGNQRQKNKTIIPEGASAAIDELLQVAGVGTFNGKDTNQTAVAKRDMMILRLLTENSNINETQELTNARNKANAALQDCGVTASQLGRAVVRSDYLYAQEAAETCLQNASSVDTGTRSSRIDRILCSRRVGLPLMLLLLMLVFYVTLIGANKPSAWLSEVLLGFEDTLAGWLTALKAPEWLVSALTDGMYRSLAWVVSVMLPPMAIFFPLFTLLEDLGYLPRIAFNMDRCFHRCQACGKQALCMCMGLGCNAVGVTGCRIIQSPRERMIAILTNALTPCNGRLPFLITLLSAFLVTVGGIWGMAVSAAALVGLILLSVLATLGLSALLSKTLLKGMSSAFVLELPPFRVPKTGQVILRSMLDRTAFVLMRAVAVAAPAGLVLWMLGHITISGSSLLAHGATMLDPLGRLMGLDGVILLAFLLGLPANEIVLPIMLMIYLQQGQLIEPAQTDALRIILQEQGWTALTALCTALFSLFHWPCSTTILTIRKETGSNGWTLLAILLPTLLGFAVCTFTAALGRLIQLL